MCRHVLVIGRRVKLLSCMWPLMGRSLWLELFLRRRRFLRSASIWSLRRSLNSPTPWWEKGSTSLTTKRPTSMNRWTPLLLRITLLLTQKKRRKWRSLQLHCQCKCWSCCFECCQGWLKAWRSESWIRRGWWRLWWISESLHFVTINVECCLCNV